MSGGIALPPPDLDSLRTLRGLPVESYAAVTSDRSSAVTSAKRRMGPAKAGVSESTPPLLANAA